MARLQSRPFYLTFCFVCAAVAIIIAMKITINLCWDGFEYINTAQNIFYGHGFVSAGNELYRLWPPMYPMMIAGLMHLGIGAEQAAQVIIIASYSLMVFPLFFLNKITTKSVFISYFVCLVYITFFPFVFTISWVSTDIVSIFFTMMGMLFLVRFLQTKNQGILFLSLAAVLASLSCLTRFLGVAFLVVGVIAIFYKNSLVISQEETNKPPLKVRLWRTFTQGALFVVIGFLPLLTWQLYRSRGLVGGGRPIESIAYRFLRVGWSDFFGSLPVVLTVVLLGVLAYAIILLILRHEGFSYLKRNLLYFAYIVVYSVAFVIIAAIERTDPVETRFLAPIYPFILLLAVPLVLGLYRYFKNIIIRRIFFLTSICLLILFMVFQVILIFDYAKVTDRGYGKTWEQETGISWMVANIGKDAIVYSNSPEPFQFKLNRIVYYTPYKRDDVNIDAFFNMLAANSNQDIYVIGHDIINTMSTAEIEEVNSEYQVLELVAVFPQAKVWHVIQ